MDSVEKWLFGLGMLICVSFSVILLQGEGSCGCGETVMTPRRHA